MLARMNDCFSEKRLQFLQIHSRILNAKIVEKVGSDNSIDLDLEKWPSNFIIYMYCNLI